MSEDAWIEPRTVSTLALAVRRQLDLMLTRLHLTITQLDLILTRLYLINNQLDLIHTQLDLILTRLDLIHTWLDLIHTRLDIIPSSLGRYVFGSEISYNKAPPACLG